MADQDLKLAERIGRLIPSPVLFVYPVTQAIASEVIPEIPIFVAIGSYKITSAKGYGALVLAGARLIIRARNASGATTLLNTTSGTFTALGTTLTLASYTFAKDDLLTIEIQKPSPQALVPFSILFVIEPA